MSSRRWFAVSLIAVGLSVAVAQVPSDGASAATAPEDDGVLEFVREMREARAREPVVDRKISIYLTHYMAGPQRFDSLDALLEHIKGHPPSDFSMTILAECSARARMEEFLARKAELDQAHMKRFREEGRSDFYRIGIGAPNEWPW